MRLRSWLLGFALLSCAPTVDSSTPVFVLRLDVARQLRLMPLQLTTLVSGVEARGAAGKVIGGADIVIDPDDPGFQSATGSISVEQYQATVLKNTGGTPRVDYALRDGGYLPLDVGGLVTVSHYANLELAYRHWHDTLGQTPAPRVSYLNPSYRDEDPNASPMYDSRYAWELDAFVFVPPSNGLLVPTALNPGIVGREYARAMFDQRVNIPSRSSGWSGSTGLRVLWGLDEGLADYHGFLTTCDLGSDAGTASCDPAFLALSLPAEDANRRDMSNNNAGCLPPSELDYLTQPTSRSDQTYWSSGNPYRVGTAIASALYFTALKLPAERPAFNQAIVAAYNDDRADRPGIQQLIEAYDTRPYDATLPVLLEPLVSHVTENSQLRDELCKQLNDRLRLGLDGGLPAVEGCSDERGIQCP